MKRSYFAMLGLAVALQLFAAIIGDEVLPTIDESIDLLTPDVFNKLHKTDLTPFGVYTYQYATISGVYDQLFDVHFTPSEAHMAYLDSGTVYATFLFRPMNGDLPLRIADAGQRAFERGATPFRFYRSFANLYEDYMNKKNTITPENTRHLAYLYYVELDKILKSTGMPQNDLEKFHKLSVANANYMASLGDVSQEDMIYIQERFVYEIDRI